MGNRRGIKLHVLIGILIVCITISAVAINTYVSVSTYKSTLTENYLNSNYTYAMKLTDSTEHQLNYMQNNIEAMASFAAQESFTADDLHTWYVANRDQFNSIFLTDADGEIEMISPRSVQVKYSNELLTKGSVLHSVPIKRALKEQKPFISEPYYSSTNQLVSVITAPMFDLETEEFLGVIGGAIFLESENVLNNILASHEFEDESYAYVVDEAGKLIYHPNKERLGDDVSANKIVQRVMDQKEGSLIETNTEGVEFFAGYSYLPEIGWGIISQTPTSIATESVSRLFRENILYSILFAATILILSGVIVTTITKPLNELARFSEKISSEDYVEGSVKQLNIRSPIYEIRQLYFQVIEHLWTLNKQANMDGLTKIANRRLFNTTVHAWIDQKTPFTLVMLDIDFFKKVNDEHGHLIGDEVLKKVANDMQRVSGHEDICFRYGGEEFGVLLKNQDEEEGFEWAEKLRRLFAETPNPSGEVITLSLGITSSQISDIHLKTIINRADAALYHSKRTGRNQTTIYETSKHKDLL